MLKSLWLNHRLLHNKVNSRKIKLEGPKGSGRLVVKVKLDVTERSIKHPLEGSHSFGVPVESSCYIRLGISHRYSPDKHGQDDTQHSQHQLIANRRHDQDGTAE